MAVNFFIAFSGLWVIFPGVLLGLFLVNQVLILPDCLIQVGGGMVMVFPPVRVRVVIFRFSAPLLDFFDYPDGAATELFNGTLKLRYSSTPFSKKLPSWPVSHLSCSIPVVGPGPGTSVHFPDYDPVLERPAKRLRITCKSSALRREPLSGDGLPTPERWKRLVPQGTESLGIEDGVPPFLFRRTGVG